MKFKPEDFPADYVTKELAASTAQDLFNQWASTYQVCTHPPEKVVLPKSGYLFTECEFQCLCGAALKMSVSGIKGVGPLTNPGRSVETETALDRKPLAFVRSYTPKL